MLTDKENDSEHVKSTAGESGSVTNRQDTQLWVSVTCARKNASLKRAHLSEIMVPQKTPTKMSVKAFPLKSCSQEQMVENRGAVSS